MMRRSVSPAGQRPRAILALGALMALSLAAFAQTDPHIGTWRLNVGKSVYSPGPPPRSQTRTYAQQGDSLKAVIETVQPLFGNKTSTEYTAAFDGKDYPLTGNADADTIALKRVDAWTFEATLKRGGQLVSTVRNTVSKDGKSMTVSTKGTNAQGKPVSSTAVFTKQ